MESNVEQEGTDHAALRCSFLGGGETLLLDDSGFQPSGDHSSCRKGSQHLNEVNVIDAVECRCQVRVQYPLPLRGLPVRDREYRLDRILTSPARSEPIGLRLEPGFPFGLQRIDCL